MSERERRVIMAPPARCERRKPAMVAAPAVAPAVNGAVQAAVMCAVSLVASAKPMLIELPKIELPKIELPKIDMPKIDLPLPNLPGQGKTEAEAAAEQAKGTAPKAKSPAARVPVRTGAAPKVRASGAVPVPEGAESAPTIGTREAGIVDNSSEWRRFPPKRSPGVSFDKWKEIAREINPTP